VRTRDDKVLNELDIVVDVGAVFDESKDRFDHHQQTFTTTWDESHKVYSKIRLSSAGLIYKFYGKEVLHNIL